MNTGSARFRAVIFGLSLSGIGGCSVPAAQSRSDSDSATPSNSPSSASYKVKSDPEPISNPGLIADAAAQVQPSVVTINTEYQPRMAYSDSPFGQEATMHPRGTGSGVILSADG